MKLEKLNYLEQALIKEFSQENISALLYYKHDSNWFSLTEKLDQSDPLTTSLEATKQKSAIYHPPKSLIAYFFISSSDAVISLEFTKSPRSIKKNKCRLQIEKIQESSFNAYRVSHNPLTFLLAKDAFKEKLWFSIKELETDNLGDSETQGNKSPKMLAVLALDIDFFKQVNDTWGHLYGDQVLKVFGKRLDDMARQIQRQTEESVSIHAGHPSGEEFLILIEAYEIREKIEKWANDFRSKIAEDLLPSESEWQWLCTNSDLSALTPPSIQDRTITTSIGVALYTSNTDMGTATDLVSSLLEAADTALYRAKAAGRNQVIFYDDILSNCGRIIELDSNTRVAAIDIGANVGVTIGQEFKVFAPTFTGKTKFSVTNGRTTRTLGFYPRVESARITVFNTQPEISFAFISSTDTKVHIEEGSHLEAIPAGSIGHLLPSSSKYYPASNEALQSNIESLQEFIKDRPKSNTIPFAIIIRFSRETGYLKKFGTAALNIALARLYREAQSKFYAAKPVEILDQGSICIVGAHEAYSEKIATDLTDQIAMEFPDLGVVSGIFCSGDLADGIEPSNAIEFARFAASDHGRTSASRVRHFSYLTAKDVLQSLRRSGSYEIAQTDFERLRSLGINNADILNMGGLIYSALGQYQKALPLYQEAINKDPKINIYKTNFGTTSYQLSKIEPALEILNKLPQADINKILKSHPYGYTSYVAMLAKAKTSAPHLFLRNRFLLIAPIALGLATIPQHQSKLIKQALSTD
ncbi:diguanylate cyclase [Pseudomonas sp. S1Bt23]|uniref:diguanylate cyclase n=1 Tax=Pseudomonas sp. S1Bt23 TaxID=3095074 RepID=UPI002A5AFA87|nr:diguanylate cyclase [Pseudomonas sp. S1Bt23]WPO48096.1 diguanylate cyclase [Pseudomonas sp. S1Bt23]